MTGEGGPKKNKVRERLLALKQKFHASGQMQPVIIDLQWYLDSKKSGGPLSSNNPTLWNTMSRVYKEFSNDEIEELINQLQAD